ncbi:hypothetical protein Tco_1509296 [Tanacetum coccineum]
MLNKENYVSWSSRLLRYAKSRPNGKLIYNSIMNGPYVRRMIPEPEANNPAILTILLGLLEDIYATVDSCETAQEIWLRVQQIMKGSDIGIQEKKAKLFNEWERFTSTDGESVKSYYHRFSKLMNDFKRNKHFPEKIASNLKWIEWDVPLGGEMDEPMKIPGFDEEEELNEFMDDDQDVGDEEIEEWLMTPVTPPRATMTVPSTYEVGSLSTATPVGHPLTTMTSDCYAILREDDYVIGYNLEGDPSSSDYFRGADTEPADLIAWSLAAEPSVAD